MTEAMHTVETARTAVLARIQPLGVERVSLTEALGRVLGADVTAPYDNPPHDNSAMDGFAVRWTDVADASAQQPVTLEVIEDIPAGYVGQKTVGAGQASRIMTGAPMPAGADTVVPVEDTAGSGDRVDILDPDAAGANVRRRGEDMRAGEALIEAGTALGPGEIGILGAVQRPFVAVGRRPTIGILSSGDELVEIDEPRRPGQIVNTNTPALGAVALACGAVPVLLPTVRDDEAAIRAAVQAAAACDFVVSSGGVSVGDYDYVKKVLDDMGAEQVLWRVAMKPGKPLLFCVLPGGTPYFGLPGNPVSSLVSFLQFVRPAIRKAVGYPEAAWPLPEATARLEHELENDGNRRTYLRARLRLDDEGRLLASTQHREQGSHMLTSMLGANGFAIIEPETRLAAGATLTVQIVGAVGGPA